MKETCSKAKENVTNRKDFYIECGIHFTPRGMIFSYFILKNSVGIKSYHVIYGDTKRVNIEIYEIFEKKIYLGRRLCDYVTYL